MSGKLKRHRPPRSVRRVRLFLVFRLKREPPYNVARGRGLKGVGWSGGGRSGYRPVGGFRVVGISLGGQHHTLTSYMFVICFVCFVFVVGFLWCFYSAFRLT